MSETLDRPLVKLSFILLTGGVAALLESTMVSVALADLGSEFGAGSLIAFRIVQGMGSGLILPLMQAILAEAAGPRRFGRAMSLVAIPGQLAPIVGPVFGSCCPAHAGRRRSHRSLARPQRL